MNSKQFMEKVIDIVENEFKLTLNEEQKNVFKELVESYEILGGIAGTPVANLVEGEKEGFNLEKILKVRNQKDEEILLIYIEGNYGVFLNLTNPHKSQIGNLPIIKK